MNKRTIPTVGVNDATFVYKTGADVQALWRKHGWIPPSELKPAPPPERPEHEPALKPLRVVRK